MDTHPLYVLYGLFTGAVSTSGPTLTFVNSQLILDCVMDKHIMIHVRLHQEM